MIDKLLQQYTGSPNVSGVVQEETSKAGQVGKGLEGQKQKYGLRMKRGGNINMEYAKNEKRQQAFEDRQKKNRAEGKLKAIEFGKKLKKITQKPKDLTDKFLGFMEQTGKSLFDEVTEKKPISKKAGGFIAKGCGKVMSDKIKKTKMY
jgi:hypothetical protein